MRENSLWTPGPARSQIKPLVTRRGERGGLSSRLILHLHQQRTRRLSVPYLQGKGCKWKGIFHSPKYFMSGIKWKQLPKSYPRSSISSFCCISTTGRYHLGGDRSQPETPTLYEKEVCATWTQHRVGNSRKENCSPLRGRLRVYTYLPLHTYVYIHRRGNIHTCIGTNSHLYTLWMGKKQPFEYKFINSARSSFGLLLFTRKVPKHISKNNQQKGIASHSRKALSLTTNQ